MIRVGIIGASGYSGGELLRIFLAHAQADVVYVTSNEHAGKPIAAAHPNLRGMSELVFTKTPAAAEVHQLPVVDCVFLALPHGHACSLVPKLIDSTRVIDLSGDFRLVDAAAYEKHYGLVHSAPEHLKDFVYGLTELNRNRISEARYIANPGCFATAAALGLAPVAAIPGLVEGMVVVDAKTGSSGSGIKPTAGTHHPDRAEGFCAYKSFAHQHVPEIVQALDAVSKKASNRSWSDQLLFQTHSAPFVRGIFASIYFETSRAIALADLKAIYSDFYKGRSFIRFVEGSPNVKWVAHSNFVDIGMATEGSKVAVFVALDNLVKGAAGQAVQNFNVMFGLGEEVGLRSTGGHP